MTDLQVISIATFVLMAPVFFFLGLGAAQARGYSCHHVAIGSGADWLLFLFALAANVVSHGFFLWLGLQIGWMP